MRKPDERIRKAIYSLKGNPDFEIFVKWIEDSYTDLVSVLVRDGVTPDHTHRVNQGRALSCYQLLEVIKNPNIPNG